MNRVARKGLVTALVAGGVIASAACAQADAAARGASAKSPGVLAGNAARPPVHLAVHACANTRDLPGLLDPASGDTCASTSGAPTVTAPRAAFADNRPTGQARSTAGASADVRPAGGGHAAGRSADSPGARTAESPRLPAGLLRHPSGDSAKTVRLAGPAFGDTAGHGTPPTPPPPAHLPIPAPPNPTHSTRPEAEAEAETPTLADTGAAGLGWTGGVSAALLFGGTALYHQGRRGAPAVPAQASPTPPRL